MSSVQARLLISGQVQGVFYRVSCQEEARKRKIVGWVRNLPGNQVEVLAQGERDQVKGLVEWCRKGPPRARVENVEVQWETAESGHSGFFVTE